MLKLEVIGNLGADAQLKNDNGHSYLHFRVAHTDKFQDMATGQMRETTTWVSCFYSGRADGILPYLVSGTKVFVRGHMTVQIYSSPKTHEMECGVTLRVTDLELCGGASKQERQELADAKALLTHLQGLGYKDISEIPLKQ